MRRLRTSPLAVMAVQTHHSSKSVSPDFRTLIQPFEAGCNSDMTSTSPQSFKKRAREVEISSPITRSQQNFGFQRQFQQTNMVQPNMLVSSPTYTEVVNGVLYYVSPAATSTSGRSAMEDNFFSQLCNQCEDIDTIVHLHTEQLRLGLQETSRRHCNALLSMLQQQAVDRLREKKTEIEKVSQRNAKLEEKVRQLAVESQFWFDVARNNEDIVFRLRETLDQVSEGSPLTEEGSCESEGVVHHTANDDAQSCFYGEEDAVRRRRAQVCKSCREGKVTVLLLPCRHLCLCEDCESTSDACPLCHSVKKASVHIAVS